MSVFCLRSANAAGCRNHRHLIEFVVNFSKSVSVFYEQGQSPQKGIREYFYFIDHQGQLFLDDAKMKNFTSCFKGLYLLLPNWSNKNLLYATKML